MNGLGILTGGFWRWLDRVAQQTVALVSRYVTKPTARFVERDFGRFALVPSTRQEAADLSGAEVQIENGALVGDPPPKLKAVLRGRQIELILRSDRFVFRPLELPSRAMEFLDGVVRSQIDRLTPWSADQAAFGFSSPAEAGVGRIEVTVAATAKAMLLPLANAFRPLGAHSVTVGTARPEEPAAPTITVLRENTARILDVTATRRTLSAVLAGAVLFATMTAIAAALISDRLQERHDALAREIAQQRTAIFGALNAPGDAKTVAERALALRKTKSPSAVITLEILSQILPDDTYVTELRIEGDKLRITGITRDAPRLISLIEQTRHFSQATFFAPITRLPSDPGDRFSIEARINPDFSLTP
jgi:general secretion pathway protein L